MLPQPVTKKPGRLRLELGKAAVSQWKLPFICFLSKTGQKAGQDLLEEDLQVLSSRLYLADRKDGTERGLRQSAWFTFIKQEKIVG
jgi:hypothetical protein